MTCSCSGSEKRRSAAAADNGDSDSSSAAHDAAAAKRSGCAAAAAGAGAGSATARDAQRHGACLSAERQRAAKAAQRRRCAPHKRRPAAAHRGLAVITLRSARAWQRAQRRVARASCHGAAQGGHVWRGTTAASGQAQAVRTVRACSRVSNVTAAVCVSRTGNDAG
jgi:hypothetical protein